MDELQGIIAERLDEEVPDGVRVGLLRQKRQLWFRTVYDAKVDVELAELTGNEALLNQARGRLKEAIKTIYEIEKKIAEFGEGIEEVG